MMYRCAKITETSQRRRMMLFIAKVDTAE